ETAARCWAPRRLCRYEREQGRPPALSTSPAHHEFRHSRRLAVGRERHQCSDDRSRGSPRREVAAMNREALDLTVLAENGLRRGRTTGTCATAACKAALLLLLRNQSVTEVRVSLPNSRYYLAVPIHDLQR